ncbi:MAG: hypothetical protein QOJ41_250 [Acidobacteriaceae bacterium]|jgi:hypothetical protein|nr:hypothetical protein [Acidobacteriaceae bacterium]
MNQRTCGGSNAILGRFPIFTSKACYSTQILRPLIDNAQMFRLAGFIQIRSFGGVWRTGDRSACDGIAEDQ